MAQRYACMHVGLQLTSMVITVKPLDLFYAAAWMDLEYSLMCTSNLQWHNGRHVLSLSLRAATLQHVPISACALLHRILTVV